MKTMFDKITELSQDVHSQNRARGFYECAPLPHDLFYPDFCIARLGLVVSEVAETIEEVRAPNPKNSDKIPGFTAEEEEVADTIIRLLDYAGFRQMNIGQAISAKLAHNATRGYRHGLKRA